MSDLRITLTQTRYTLLTAMRNPQMLVFGVAFPVVLLVLFNSIFTTGSSHVTRFAAGQIPTTAYYTAGMAAYAIMLQTFSLLAISVTTQRESGQLKRLRGTPVPAWTFITAYVLRSIALTVVMVIALFGVGVAAFGVTLHASGVLGIAVYTAVGTAALASLGIALTVYMPTADAASSAAPFTAVMLSFISGVFIPISSLPGWLKSIGQFFPLYHLADGLQRSVQSTGWGLDAGDLLALAIWGAVGLVIAARTFKWEPQGTRG